VKLINIGSRFIKFLSLYRVIAGYNYRLFMRCGMGISGPNRGDGPIHLGFGTQHLQGLKSIAAHANVAQGSRLNKLTEISGFHGDDYDECRLLG
jgi:hypothetical protein